MSIEFTDVKKETVSNEINNFLESCPEDTVFKMVINSKKGYFKIKIKKPKNSRIRKLFRRLKKINR